MGFIFNPFLPSLPVPYCRPAAAPRPPPPTSRISRLAHAGVTVGRKKKRRPVVSDETVILVCKRLRSQIFGIRKNCSDKFIGKILMN